MWWTETRSKQLCQSETWPAVGTLSAPDEIDRANLNNMFAYPSLCATTVECVVSMFGRGKRSDRIRSDRINVKNIWKDFDVLFLVFPYRELLFLEWNPLYRGNERRRADKVPLRWIAVDDTGRRWSIVGGKLCRGPCAPNPSATNPGHNPRTLYRTACNQTIINNTWLNNLTITKYSPEPALFKIQHGQYIQTIDSELNMTISVFDIHREKVYWLAGTLVPVIVFIKQCLTQA